MYICETHGELESEWCDDCGKIVRCDCSTSETTRWKDLYYGERWSATIYLEFCPTCGHEKQTWIG
jgi:hypothetical protein